MILTVTLNAAIDKRYVVEDFREGEVNRVKECDYVPGGKGINVAKTVAIAGMEVVATGFLGGYSGKYIENALEQYHVKADFTHLEAESRSCINIWDEKHKTQTEFLEPGFTVTEKDFERFLEKFQELLEKAEVVVISGSVPNGLDGMAYDKLISLVKEKGKKVVLDTSGKLLKVGMAAKPTLIKPNMDEIEMLTGTKCNDIETILSAAKTVHESGIENVVVSMGGDGALLVCSEGMYRSVVPKIETANTVGCGDAMSAGFAMGIANKLEMQKVFRIASAISAAAAMQEKTGYFSVDDMKKLYSSIKIEKL